MKSIINHQSSIINHQSSIINHQSSIYNLQSTIYNLQSTIYNLQSIIINHKRAVVITLYSMLITLLISPPLLSQQNTDTGWKVINKDVYKKDTSGRVVIGNVNNPSEKLEVGGNVRIDGLRGFGDRILYVDEGGKLRAGKPCIGAECLGDGPGGGQPDVLPPDTMKHESGGGGGGSDKTSGGGVNKEHCGITGGCMIGIGTDNPLKKLHIFTDHTVVNPDSPVYVAEEEPIEEEPIIRRPGVLPEIHSHYGIRLDDRANNSDVYPSNMGFGTHS